MAGDLTPREKWVAAVIQIVGDYLMRIGLFLLKERPEVEVPKPPIFPLPPGVPEEPGPPSADWPNTRFGPVPGWLRPIIERHFPPGAWMAAAEISRAESGWNPGAVNDTRHLGGGKCNVRYPHPLGFSALTEWSVGLFQINICAHGGDPGTWTNPDTNVAKAASLYRAAGWRPWAYSARRLGYLR